MEESIRRNGSLSLNDFDLSLTTEELKHHFESSPLLQKHQLQGIAKQIDCRGDTVSFGETRFNSYHASALADLLRRKALKENRTFSFETVMSSPDKVELLREARAQGFRTYLYYIATEDPAINIGRVKLRTMQGGHDVPEEKIISRYYRSLQLLSEAIQLSSRAFIFDTSEANAWYFAEATDGRTIELKSDQMPDWFEPIWSRF